MVQKLSIYLKYSINKKNNLFTLQILFLALFVEGGAFPIACFTCVLSIFLMRPIEQDSVYKHELVVSVKLLLP